MTAITRAPILASWKISEVLDRYPDLLETLTTLTPAFGALRNPVMRKVQTRLVTVAQAAAIAGIDPAQLVQDLNRAAGIVPAAEAAPIGDGFALPSALPSWHGRSIVFQELDVRPMLARGEEPFTVIAAAAHGVPAGQVLRVLVGFEPLPLYDAMAKLGFEHAAKLRDGCWRVDFLRVQGPRKPDAVPTATPVPGDDTGSWGLPETASLMIDISNLVPPEPMVAVLRALDDLPDGARLLVHHVRRPIHLYDRLDEMGYPHATRELAPDRIDILIEKQAGGGVAGGRGSTA